MARKGRRPGQQDTREAILAAARRAFADRGFDGTSIRAIATGAGVDPALVHHYFGTKDQLFLAAMRAPFDPGAILPEVLAAGLDGVGVRLVRTILRAWDSPAGSAAAAVIRSAMSNERMARMLREFIINRILRRLVTDLRLDPADGPFRASLVASQIGGLVMTRYLMRIEPIASADPEVLAAALGPTIQRYLEADLGLGGPARDSAPATRSSAGR